MIVEYLLVGLSCLSVSIPAAVPDGYGGGRQPRTLAGPSAVMPRTCRTNDGGDEPAALLERSQASPASLGWRASRPGAGMMQLAETDTGVEATRKQRVDLAKRELKAAEQRLEQAKEVGPGDRKGTAGGGSRLTESYHERVRSAEADVEAARRALIEAKQSSP